MLRETVIEVKRKRRVKHRGVRRAARELGVSAAHLWLVLDRQRDSEKLMRRYREWRQANRIPRKERNGN